MSCDSANTLPLGWAKCSIADVSLPISKIDPKDDPDREISYIDISGIDNTRHVIRSVKQYRLKDAPSRARQIVHTGDVLFATVRPYLRNIACVPDDYNEQVSSTGFSVLRPANGISPDFLFYKAISKDFVDALSEVQYGVSYPAVKDDQVRDQPLWLPPKDEQLRIVAKIKELFSGLDKGVESLKTARRQLEVYRQSTLKHSFEGKLTAQWREENKDKLGTLEQSLARIERERSACYEQQLKEWKAAVAKWEEGGKSGIRPSRPAGFKSQVPIELSELTELPAIPQLWQYVRLSEIALIGSGMSVSKSRKLTNPFQVPYLSVANVQRGELDLSTVKTMEIEHAQLPRLALRRWDVLFNEGGDRDKLGRGWVWEAQIEPCITQNHVFRASPFFESHSHSKWISHWGNTFGQLYFEAQGKQTTNLASINKAVLSRFPIPVPPVAEQEEIIRRLESQLAIVDHLEREVTSSLGQLGALRQSILKKAFSGQLVSQDPHDEPASVLLDRIRAERKQKAKSGIVRRRTKKKGAAT